MKKKIFVFVLLLALLPAAHAFSVSFTSINNSIFPDQSAAYAVTIVNDQGFNDTFRISTRNPNWVISVEPSLSGISPFSTKSFTLRVKPKQGLELGPYAVPIKTKSIRTSKFKEENLLVNLKPRTPFGGEYAPAVQLRVDSPLSIDPRNKVPVTVSMDNKNPRDMPNLTVSITLGEFEKVYETSLSPLAQRSSEHQLVLEPTMKPGLYDLRTSLVLGNITIAEVSKDVEVVEYAEVKEKLNRESRFFRITNAYTLTNEANVENTITKKIRVPFYERLFTSFEPEPEKVVQDGKTYFQWEKRLQPNATMEVVVLENYRGLALAILISILGLIAYYLFRSPVVVSKVSFVSGKEGDQPLMKVQLEVKNRSKERIRSVTVLDKIPSMATYVKKEQPGTIPPSKVVKSSSKGTSMRWELDILEPHEERIITYHIKSKLQVVGGLNLPPAKTKFETANGKERSTYSNNASVLE